MTPEALSCARTIFDYMQLRHTPARADAMVVFGTNDLRVPKFAAELFHAGFAPMAVLTGGIAHQNDLLATDWTEPEAEVFADVMVREGVPRDRILLEPRATNTSENVRFSREIFEAHGLAPESLLLVCKPFMQRRVFATHAAVWPEVPVRVVSWPATFDEYCCAELPTEKVTNIMIGDLQRIPIYARRGWSAVQPRPQAVHDAFNALKAMGFTHHLLPEEGTVIQ